jgi:two-component system nitrogen regulation response regulator NtrX
MKNATLLIVDDEKNILTALSRPLLKEGYQVRTAQCGQDALDLIQQEAIDLALLDVWLPDIDGLNVLQKAKEMAPDLIAIVMSGHGNIDTAVKATKLGAFDFMEKPLNLDKVLLLIEHALKYRKLEEDNRKFRQAEEEEYRIIGNSPQVKELLERIFIVASTPSRVLITGENGTGKELVARAIHKNSPRKDGPFIKVNCAAIPNELIESELFGHERGSFTGAVERKRGKFELANHGTIFLDEIGDMSLPTQAKILRVLTDNEIDRVGGAKPIQVDVRVIAATNKNLEEEIQKDNFREDLYYRLNVVPIQVPPLRERREDIPLLVEHFLKLYCKETQTKARKFDNSAFELLKNYDWPGNIRELRNIIERAAILTRNDIIGEKEIASVLPNSVAHPPVSRPMPAPVVIPAFPAAPKNNIPEPPKKASLREMAEEYEKNVILETLKNNDWNVTKTAEILELERSHLYKKMKIYGISRED